MACQSTPFSLGPNSCATFRSKRCMAGGLQVTETFRVGEIYQWSGIRQEAPLLLPSRASSFGARHSSRGSIRIGASIVSFGRIHSHQSRCHLASRWSTLSCERACVTAPFGCRRTAAENLRGRHTATSLSTSEPRPNHATMSERRIVVRPSLEMTSRLPRSLPAVAGATRSSATPASLPRSSCGQVRRRSSCSR